MTKFEFLKFVHVLFAVIWVGGGFLALVLTIMSRRATPEYRLGLGRAMGKLSLRLLSPSAIVVLAFGIWMVLDADPFEFEQLWIIFGIAGVAISAFLGMGYLGPKAEKLVEVYESGDAAAGDALLDKIWRVALVDTAVLLFVVWAMVAKPGL